MISLDNNAAERALRRRPVMTRKNAYGSRTDDACGRSGGKPLTDPDLERFLPWNAAPEDLHTWAKPPPHR